MEEHTPVSAPQALEDLEVCYRDFIEKLKKSKASSVGEVMGNFFRAQGNPRVSYAVEEFDAACRKLAEQADKDQATATISAISAQAGAWAVRVHDPATSAIACRVVSAIADHAPSTARTGAQA